MTFNVTNQLRNSTHLLNTFNFSSHPIPILLVLVIHLSLIHQEPCLTLLTPYDSANEHLPSITMTQDEQNDKEIHNIRLTKRKDEKETAFSDNELANLASKLVNAWCQA